MTEQEFKSVIACFDKKITDYQIHVNKVLAEQQKVNKTLMNYINNSIANQNGLSKDYVEEHNSDEDAHAGLIPKITQQVNDLGTLVSNAVKKDVDDDGNPLVGSTITVIDASPIQHELSVSVYGEPESDFRITVTAPGYEKIYTGIIDSSGYGSFHGIMSVPNSTQFTISFEGNGGFYLGYNRDLNVVINELKNQFENVTTFSNVDSIIETHNNDYNAHPDLATIVKGNVMGSVMSEISFVYGYEDRINSLESRVSALEG